MIIREEFDPNLIGSNGTCRYAYHAFTDAEGEVLMDVYQKISKICSFFP